MTPVHIDPEDLTLFALQFLSPEEAAEIVTHLEHSSEAREELAAIQGDLVSYAMSADMHTPPAAARERLMRRVAKEKKLIPIDRSAVPEPVLISRGNRDIGLDASPAPRATAVGWFGWMGWAAAAGIAVFAGLQFHSRQGLQQAIGVQNRQIAALSTDAAHSAAIVQALTDSSALQVALHLPSTDAKVPPQPQAEASYLPDTGSLVFVASHLQPLQSYKTYELWVLPANGQDPIPAGLFKPDVRGNASVVMPDIPKGVVAAGFGVTIEDDGGSKQGPTKPIVLVGISA
jgi:anti-sigma-K factor RskA